MRLWASKLKPGEEPYSDYDPNNRTYTIKARPSGRTIGPTFSVLAEADKYITALLGGEAYHYPAGKA